MFDFPASPTVGQSVTTPSGSTFVWDGVKWTSLAGSSGGGITISDTSPASPTVGSGWWNSLDGQLYIYYTDPNTSQWVPATNTAASLAGAYLPLTGGVLSGPGNLTVSGAATINGNLTVQGVGGLSLTGGAMHGGTAGEIFNNGSNAWVYRETSHIFQTQGGGITVATLNTTGLNIGSGAFTANAITCGSGIVYSATAGHSIGFGWTGSLVAYVDGTNVGNVTLTSDYRIKENVADLPSTWDQVKSLRPISYTHKDYGALVRVDATPWWGFIAHELQETLIQNSATGYKDAPDLIQSPNPLVLLAAVTKALQEAMDRIEALEAKLL